MGKTPNFALTLAALAAATLAGAARRARAAAPDPAPRGSVGHYSRGSLEGGVPLPEDADDFYALFPARCYAQPAFAAEYSDPSRRENTWGNEVTVAAIAEVAVAVRRAHPDMPRLAVGELSNRTGGLIPQHLSHQNGLDVDVLFPQRGEAADAARWPVPPCTPYGQHRRYEHPDAAGHWGVDADFEAAWTWSVAEAFAARDDVQAILVGTLIRKALSDYARAAHVPAAVRQRTLARLVPVFCAAPAGVKLPFYRNNFCPHDDHLHVRMKCPKADRACRSHR